MELEEILKHKKEFSREEFAELLAIIRSSGKSAQITIVDDPDSPQAIAAKEYVRSHGLLPEGYESFPITEIETQGALLFDARTAISLSLRQRQEI